MKKFLLLIAILSMAIPVFSNAEERTLISGEIESGGYGGPVVKLSSVNSEFCVFMGGRGGWIINHAFVVGGGAYGLATDILVSGKKLAMGYGGIELGYVFFSDSLIHFTVHSLFGFGGLSLETDPMSADEFFVIEPEATVVMNVTRFFRIAAGTSYRFVMGVTTPGLSDAGLSGLTGQLIFKFGAF
jgi:hypothetical protein